VVWMMSWSCDVVVVEEGLVSFDKHATRKSKDTAKTETRRLAAREMLTGHGIAKTTKHWLRRKIKGKTDVEDSSK
jgi:hypothetical protein